MSVRVQSPLRLTGAAYQGWLYYEPKQASLGKAEVQWSE